MSVRSPSDPSLELDIGEICSFEFSDTEFKKILNDELNYFENNAKQDITGIKQCNTSKPHQHNKRDPRLFKLFEPIATDLTNINS